MSAVYANRFGLEWGEVLRIKFLDEGIPPQRADVQVDPATGIPRLVRDTTPPLSLAAEVVMTFHNAVALRDALTNAIDHVEGQMKQQQEKPRHDA